MTFKDFFLMQELQGHLGAVGQGTGLSVLQNQIKLHKPVRNKGTSIGRMMSAGTVKSPSRPASITSISKPMTMPSVLN